MKFNKQLESTGSKISSSIGEQLAKIVSIINAVNVKM